jgi:hypothetical protein
LTRNIVVERGQVHLQLDIAGCEKSGSGSNGSNCVSSLIARHTKYIHNSIPFDHSFIPNTMPDASYPNPQLVTSLRKVVFDYFLAASAFFVSATHIAD